MSSFYMAIGAIALIAIVAFCIAQHKDAKNVSTFFFFVVVAVCVALVIVSFVVPPERKLETSTYRIAYNDGVTMTVIDDATGNPKTISVANVAHANASYGIGDIIVVASDSFGNVMFFSPNVTSTTAAFVGADG